MSSVCTGEPMRQDMFARLSEMQDCTAMTVYHQPGTAMGLALYWAGDLEAARPLLERAAQQGLGARSGVGPTGRTPDARASRI